MFLLRHAPALSLALIVFALGCATDQHGRSTFIPQNAEDTKQSTAPDVQQSQPKDLTSSPDISVADITPEPVDDPVALSCGANLAREATGEALMGAPCEEHTDCETGFCYGGKFMTWAGGFKFCTIACQGCPAGSTLACADFDVLDGPSYKCVMLPSACHQDDYPVHAFCMAGCQGSNGMANCNDWFGAGTYAECDYPASKECNGNIGGSKTCFVPEP